MKFNLSEEQILVRDAAREFAQTELLPDVIERDELQKFPHNLVKKNGGIRLYEYHGRPKIWWQWYGYAVLCTRHGGTL